MKENQYLSPNQKALKRLLKNKAAIFGLVIIGISIFLALFAYLIIPDQTPNADYQNLELATKEQGFSVQILERSKNNIIDQENIFTKMRSGQVSTVEYIPIKNYSFYKDKIIIDRYTGNSLEAKDTLLLADVVTALNTTTYQPIDDKTYNFSDVLGQRYTLDLASLQAQAKKQIKQKTYFLGTDKFGRDNLSRLILGVRVSLSIGLMAVLISLLVGVTLGALAGYFRSWVDVVIMWIINVFWSIPLLLWVFALILALGREFWQIYLAVGLTMWVEVARIVRGQFFSIREKEYVEAAESLGLSHFSIIFKHILPNTIGPLTVITAANFASAIIIEAGLSFLGIGVQPPQSSWGIMLNEYYTYIGTDKAFLAFIPGTAILLLSLAFNLVGNGIRDALDVKSVT